MHFSEIVSDVNRHEHHNSKYHLSTQLSFLIPAASNTDLVRDVHEKRFF
jgi:hypothetical protein